MSNVIVYCIWGLICIWFEAIFKLKQLFWKDTGAAHGGKAASD